MEKIISPLEFDRALRPKTFESYIGQQKITDKMKIYVQAATARTEALDHVLLYGPPGLGKTSLAHVIAREMNVNIHITSGPAIEKAGDLAAILTQLAPHDILFIDEIHRLSPAFEEVLYPAMEDYQLDLIIGEGPGARSMRIDLHPFCLIAATTKAGSLSSPLRDRFGIQARMDFYGINDLCTILANSSLKLGVEIDRLSLMKVAERSRGTPRVANRLLRRVRDFLQVSSESQHTPEMVANILDQLDIDRFGLDYFDRTVLTCILERFNGGPVGLEALATSVGEAKETLEDVIEPYLVQENFIHRTLRGRKLTQKAIDHLNSFSDKQGCIIDGHSTER